MNNKWFHFSKRAKVVIAGVLTADLTLLISYVQGADSRLVLVGLLSATGPPFFGYWVSE